MKRPVGQQSNGSPDSVPVSTTQDDVVSKDHGAINSHKNTEDSTNALGNFAHYTLSPAFILIFIPNFVFVFWFTAVTCGGSFLQFFAQVREVGLLTFIVRLWTSVTIFGPLSSAVIFGYSAWALLLMVLVPGPKIKGPETPKGNVPVYTDNGFSCYIITMVSFVILTVFLKLNGTTPTIIYDHFDEFIGTITVFSFLFCFLLYVKGHLWPSTSDCGSSGNFLFDYFWGLELYPRILGIDVKVFTNCRFGMTVWPLLVGVYMLKSYEMHNGFVDSAWVSGILQLVYITKFFWWETGYLCTMDIKLDRAGYYICWGCLVYVPVIYASVSLYLVNHPVILGPLLSAVILIAGLTSCALNYLADRQKQVARRTEGNCLIWGRKPEVIRATYRLDNGETRQSLLLVSGFWGIARHFHYLPELSLAFLWTLPAMFENLLPYCYFIILVILLVHRTFRDNLVCQEKYKENWDEYVRRVPYKIIPYIF